MSFPLSSTRQLSLYQRILPAIALAACTLLAALPASAQTAPQHRPDVFTPTARAQMRVMTPLAVTSGEAKLVGRYPATARLRVVLGLTPPKMAEEEAFLQRLQDRNSPDFHRYLSPEEWNARFAPSEADEQAVVDWATANGLKVAQRFANRLIVDVEGDVAAIEKAFAIQINRYQVGQSTEYSNDHDPAIPAHLQPIVQSVGGLNNIERAHSRHEGDLGKQAPDYVPGPTRAEGASLSGDADEKATAALAEPAPERAAMEGDTNLLTGEEENPTPAITNGRIDPTDIYSSYSYDYGALQRQGHCCNPANNPGGSSPLSSLAIATAFDFANSDLTGFHTRYNYLAWNVHRWFIDGTPSCCNEETTLDLEWSIATSNSFNSSKSTAQIWMYEGANNNISTFTDVYNFMLSDGLARVFSTSWGCAELNCTSGSTINTDHAIFNAMVGQGWTLLASSGDGGATDDCATRSVDYPASDPDVVGVGGTWLQLYSGGQFKAETAWQGSNAPGSCAKNNGGSGGGCSVVFSAPGFQKNPACGAGSRSVPDIALNAAAGQNLFYNGAWTGVGGTSIATPQVAGFMVQEDAYLLSIGVGCGTHYGNTCAPMGQVDWMLYAIGNNPTYAPHFPYYDITQGCNSNDIVAASAFFPYCAEPGYDQVTGWGTFNALQLSWAISTAYAGDFGAPKVTFSGPPGYGAGTTWWNSNQELTWKVADTNNGVYPSVGIAGFTQVLDGTVNDPAKQATPGTGNAFYSGPQFPNATTGYMWLANMGQGCHRVTVDAWDNTGFSSGNQRSNLLCYDTVPPISGVINYPQLNKLGWASAAVTVAVTASDPGSDSYGANGPVGSGIAKTLFAVDPRGNCNIHDQRACTVYTKPFLLSTEGTHHVTYFAEDKAGNWSALGSETVQIDLTPPVTTAALSGLQAGVNYAGPVTVTLTATDNLSGVAGTTYSLDGGANTSYTAPFTVTPVGNHTVTFFSVDNAGNTETAHSVTFTILSNTTTVLRANPTTVNAGGQVVLLAHVSAAAGGNPKGMVRFSLGDATLGTAPLNSDGFATLTLTTLPKGTDPVTARYLGMGFDLPSVSAPVKVQVN
ncbi:MAG: protease pro-enzyme activation domain-containing protein [Terracidiphilus sp.]